MQDESRQDEPIRDESHSLSMETFLDRLKQAYMVMVLSLVSVAIGLSIALPGLVAFFALAVGSIVGLAVMAIVNRRRLLASAATVTFVVGMTFIMDLLFNTYVRQ